MSDVPSKKRKTASEESSSDETSSGPVNINVGGTFFAVDANTINRYPDTMLGSMLSKRWNEDKSEKEIFLDRDPVRFRYILDFYRNGEIVIPHTITKSEMLNEIEFFSLPLEKKDIQYDMESISGMRNAIVDFENDYVRRLKRDERRSAILTLANGLAALLIEKIRKSLTAEFISVSTTYSYKLPFSEYIEETKYRSIINSEDFKETIKDIVEKAGYTITTRESHFELRRST